MIAPDPLDVFALKQIVLYISVHAYTYMCVVLIILMITLEDKQLFVVDVLFCFELFHLSTDELLRDYVVLVEWKINFLSYCNDVEKNKKENV